MKQILFIFFIGLFIGCTQHDGYTLTGEVPEAWEGKPVLLMLDDVDVPYSIDSTKISEGKFVFKGKFDIPRKCKVAIFLNPNDRQNRSLTVSFPVFLDSTETKAVCDYSGKDPRFTISGSGTQDTYQDYVSRWEPYRTAERAAFDEYSQAYYYDHDLSKAIGLAKKVTEKRNETQNFEIQYIRENPGSVVSLSIAKEICNKNSSLSLKELEKLFTTLSPRLQNSEMGKSIRKTIQEKQIIIGNSYIDKELVTPEGSPKKISDLVKPGHYTLIEFWASWCAPCRSEFPHLRESYAKYHAKGFEVINISIDSDHKAWLKALDEEKLPWTTQLRDADYGKETSAFKAYNLIGVPSSILLDDKGQIINLNARGGWLDLALQEIYD